MVEKDIMKADLYGILNVEECATEKEIVKAYRKKALKCHPDKNPDNPAAVELFQQLSKALEILTDAAARAAYDKALKAKKAAAQRHKDLDEKRKKLKEDLEAREKAHEDQTAANLAASRDLAAQIERLRKEGSRLLEEEQERLREELQQKSEPAESSDSDEQDVIRLKAKWKINPTSDTGGDYSQESLNKHFSKYGEVAALVMNRKAKRGSAIVEFSFLHGASSAIENEAGSLSNPITITWLSGKPKASDSVEKHKTDGLAPDNFTNTTTSQAFSGDRDFESLVLMRLRQAEERKRLIQQMENEGDEGT